MMRCGRWSARSLMSCSWLCRSHVPAPSRRGARHFVPTAAAARSAVPPGDRNDRRLPRPRLGQLQNIRAVVVSQRGQLLAERYYHSDGATYAELHSATKSVISTLVGIALTKGDLKSLDQTLGELLPQHRSAMSKSSARTTVRQLLTMTGGWTAFYDARRPGRSWRDESSPRDRRSIRADSSTPTLGPICSPRCWPKQPACRRSPTRGVSCSTRSGSRASLRSRARSPNAITPTW